MRILLAIDHRSDPRVVSGYVAERFGSRNIAVDILTVIPSSAGQSHAAEQEHGEAVYLPRHRGPAQLAAESFVAAVATELRARHGLSSVRTHVKCGDAANVILSASTSLRSAMIVIEAPPGKGLLTGFRRNGATRRLFGKAGCPIELLRPCARSHRSSFNALVPIGADQFADFPFAQLQTLPWPQGSRLQLLGVLPLAFDDSRVEASPATVVEALDKSRRLRVLTEARLNEVCSNLNATLDHGVEAECRVVEGNTRAVVVDGARQPHASLIVMSSAATDRAIRGMFSTLSPAAIALSAACSVLLLRPPAVRAKRPSEQAENHAAAQPQHRPA
jgi:nucleotide-binding universal stress UspA family protein